jgi:hypothetical protein
MAIKVLGGDFDKIDGTFSKTAGFIFNPKSGKLADIIIVKPEEVARTYYADDRAMTHADVPDELRAAYAEERKTLPHPANMELVVIFKDGRWTYIRVEKKLDALNIHQLAPGDRPPPLIVDADDDDDEF